MNLIQFVLGLVVLVLGRPLYWAFVGIAGFVLGAQLAGEYLAEQSQGVQLLAALAAGAVGAVVALVAVRVAFGVAGFFTGGYLTGLAVEPLALGTEGQLWAMLAGAVIGAVVAAVVMDWAIIALSSILGAALVAEALDLALFSPLIAVAGLIIQAKIMNRRRRGPTEQPKAG